MTLYETITQAFQSDERLTDVSWSTENATPAHRPHGTLRFNLCTKSEAQQKEIQTLEITLTSAYPGQKEIMLLTEGVLYCMKNPLGGFTWKVSTPSINPGKEGVSFEAILTYQGWRSL